MTSKTGKQTITVHILPQEVKTIRQLILLVYRKYGRNIFFPKNHAEFKVGRLVPNLFLFFTKALHEVKVSGQHLSFNNFRSP